MFPITDSSSTIIECLLSEARKLGVEIRLRQRVEKSKKGSVSISKRIPLSRASILS